jgi:heat shock protein 5
VTFQLDENSILTVVAKEMGSGQTKSITIANDEGRLTASEIERMVADAEKFAEEDKLIKEKLEAKHQFDNYIYTMRSTIEDPAKLANKLDYDDIEAISDALRDASDWMASNDDADKDEYEENMKTL